MYELGNGTVPDIIMLTVRTVQSGVSDYTTTYHHPLIGDERTFIDDDDDDTACPPSNIIKTLEKRRFIDKTFFVASPNSELKNYK
jgi:hypothetical protein